MILRVDLPHRRLPRPFFVGMRDETRQARDEKYGVAKLVREAEIGGHGGNRAVDIYRQWMPELARL
jgi:hypothetical protein